jgi:cytochrome c biogenesis protein ResB
MGRMEGDMRLIEGQTLSENHGNYMYINEGSIFNENHKKFNITLEKFYPDYYDESNTQRGAAGKLVIHRDGKVDATDIVYSNHLMTYGGYTFLGNVYGMSPVLALSNIDGTIFDISSIEASDLDSSGRYVSYFNLANTGLEAGLMVYMTADLTDIAESGNGKQVPIMFLKLFDNGTEIYDGTLRLNGRVRIHDNYLGKDMYLVFYDVKYWSNFYIVKDDGTLLVYAGFAFLTISLIVMFFIIPKRLWVEIVSAEKTGATEIHIGGRSDRFRSLYEEEYCSLIDQIKKRLSDGTDR